jgi:hypothetical protein
MSAHDLLYLIELRIDGFFVYTRSSLARVEKTNAYLDNSCQTIRPLSPL